MTKLITTLTENLQENTISNILEETLRDGARKMLQQAIELEVKEYLEANRPLRDENSHRMVKHNGYLPQREIQTGLGPIGIRQPRVRDLRDGHRFTSAILPPYMRRTPSIESVIPLST